MEKISDRSVKDYMRITDSMLATGRPGAADGGLSETVRVSKTVQVAAHLEDSVAHAVFSKVKDAFNALRDKFGRLSRLAGEGRERGLTYEEEDEILAELAGSLCDCLDEAIAEAARAGGRAASEIACGFENSGLIQREPWQDGAHVVKDGVAVGRSADGEYMPKDEGGEDSGLVDVRGDVKVADCAKKTACHQRRDTEAGRKAGRLRQ